MTRTLVVGLGNELRGDDAAGLLVARALRELAIDGVDVEEGASDFAELAESISRRPEVVVVDAVVADAPPGTVSEIDPDHAAATTRSSSHGFRLADAIALARVLDPNPGSVPRVRLIGIVGADFELGSRPSDAVSRAATDLARHLATQLRETAPCA